MADDDDASFGERPRWTFIVEYSSCDVRGVGGAYVSGVLG